MREQRLEKLLQMQSENPGDSFYFFAIAMEYLGLGQNEMAEQYFKRCLQLDAGHIPSHYQLGALLYSQNREEEALTFLEMGLQLLRDSKDLKTIQEFRSLRDEISF